MKVLWPKNRWLLFWSVSHMNGCMKSFRHVMCITIVEDPNMNIITEDPVVQNMNIITEYLPVLNMNIITAEDPAVPNMNTYTIITGKLKSSANKFNQQS